MVASSKIYDALPQKKETTRFILAERDTTQNAIITDGVKQPSIQYYPLFA